MTFNNSKGKVDTNKNGAVDFVRDGSVINTNDAKVAEFLYDALNHSYVYKLPMEKVGGYIYLNRVDVGKSVTAARLKLRDGVTYEDFKAAVQKGPRDEINFELRDIPTSAVVTDAVYFEAPDPVTGEMARFSYELATGRIYSNPIDEKGEVDLNRGALYERNDASKSQVTVQMQASTPSHRSPKSWRA